MTLIEERTRLRRRPSPPQAIILRELITFPELVTHERLVHALWGQDEDGGPENANASLKDHIRRLRRHLKWQYRIDARHSQGFRLRKLPESVGRLE